MTDTTDKKLEYVKANGKPVYVPGGQLKGWELGDDFVKNPDWTPPEPPPVENIQPIKTSCGNCGAEIEGQPQKAITIRGGMSHTINVCKGCANYG